jgi:hypothetical protein
MMRFLYYDAKGTDGHDLARMDALYIYNGQTVRIPANAPDPQAAIFQQLGLDPAAQAARLNTLSAERAADAVSSLAADEISAAVTVADLKAILGQLLVRVNRLSDEIVDLRTGQG